MWKWFEQLLFRFVPHKEIGWKEIGEVFYRFKLLKTPWINVYLHRLEAPLWHDHCHDHPWHFWTWLISGGYWERTNQGEFWRPPGTVLFRQAAFRHNVKTKGISWSLVVTSGKIRNWRIIEEESGECR